MKLKISVLFLSFLFAVPLYAADEETNKLGTVTNFIDDRVMYAIGGGTAIGAPATRAQPATIGLGWSATMGCGGFDIKTTITNQLNQVVEGFSSYLQSILDNAGPAAIGAAAQQLQRANPGLYEMLSNGVMQARLDFDRSKLSCEQLSNKMSEMISSNSWADMADASYFQDLIQSGNGRDAVQTMQDIDKNDGKNGIQWVGNEKAGGEGQKAIRVTADIVTAGYNALLGRKDPRDESSAKGSCNGAAVCTFWEKPSDAVKFAHEVLGETEIKTCKTDCTPKSSRAGIGLTKKIETTFEKKYKALDELVNGKLTSSQIAAKLKDAGSNMLPISMRVVEALKADQDKRLLTRRLASEVALSEVLEQALQLQRILISGGKEPNVEQTKNIHEDLQKNLNALNAEINSLQTELQIRQMLANNTASLVLDRYEAAIQSSGAIKDNGDPYRARILKLEEGESGK